MLSSSLWGGCRGTYSIKSNYRVPSLCHRLGCSGVSAHLAKARQDREGEIQMKATPTQRILLSVMVGAFMCLVLAVAQQVLRIY